MRKVGPLKKVELKSWQEREGLQVDGIFGNQSMGRVLEMERELEGQLPERPYGWMVTVALLVLFIALILGSI